jgi:hypothetical protein
MARSGLFFIRFIDDILVLAPTRWRLRKAVNEVLGSLYVVKHPGKTFIGRIGRGFDFLGYLADPELFQSRELEPLDNHLAVAQRK